MTFPGGGDDVLPARGICDPWEPIYQEGCTLPSGYEAVEATALEMASEILYALTARQFGLCTITLRPCRRECYSTSSWQSALSSLSAFSTSLTPRASQYWLGVACGSCGTDCSCTTISEVVLPGPIYDVTEVLVDGVALVKGVDYRLDNNRLLVRLGAEWPTCNNLSLPDTETGTWSVTTRRGQPVPTLGRAAMGELTLEFMKMLLCDTSCMLPKPVQSLSRQGVNITFLDPNEVFQNGRTGLYVSDMFIQTYNPHGRTQRAKVYDLDSLSNGRRLGA